MRRAQNVYLIKDDNEKPYAIHLAADHCAEHEHGINRIYMFLDAPVEEKDGLDRYTMSQQDITKQRAERLSVLTSKTETYFEWNSADRRSTKQKGKVTRLRFGYPDEKSQGRSDTRSETKMSGAFDSGGFEVIGFSDETRSFIKQLHKAILSGDFAAHMGGRNNPFGGGGLNLSIPSLVPQSVKDDVLNAHLEAHSLASAAEATGIHEILATVSDRPEFAYFALAPRRASVEEKKSTNHEVVFFLNPRSDTANYGWFTVEDLISWTEGKGPVVKERPEALATPRM